MYKHVGYLMLIGFIALHNCLENLPRVQPWHGHCCVVSALFNLSLDQQNYLSPGKSEVR